MTITAPRGPALAYDSVLGRGANLKSSTFEHLTTAEMEQFAPDIVVFDTPSPERDALALLLEIRSQATYLLTKVMFISDGEYFNSAADAHLTKPVSDLDLRTCVTTLVRLIDAERRALAVKAELEKKVQALEHKAALGARVSELLHDLRNPLMIVVTSLSQLEAEHPGDVRLERAQSAAQRITAMIATGGTGILNIPTPAPNVFDMNAILRAELALLEAEPYSSYGVNVSTAFGNLPPCRGHPAQFSQIFGNLIKNAVESMQHARTRELQLTSSFERGTILVEIRDTGGGIPPALLARIGEPRFTTKATGTGLGLSSTRRLLSEYGGNLVITSTVGEGTRARVVIPATTDPSKPSRPPNQRN